MRAVVKHVHLFMQGLNFQLTYFKLDIPNYTDRNKK
jgi:hypothetical protein